ncbi:MAG: O-acetylhomoserine aminocarboxypropyltransferase [Alphaproteobacteria bacterium]|jgi:O-acetylhomoserine (thiol)-lyase|nr:O-acetylhomoserine aminocarboxypropyltransferase [Alphaproteobacteria bacterium]
MIDPKHLKFSTLSLHAGQHPDPVTGARATPIFQTTSYVFPDVDHAASLFNLERAGHIYSRISNPTVSVFEERMAALEGGVGAIATASGQAAMSLAVMTLMGSGGHIVASRNIYGGTHNLFVHTLPRFGITTTFVDPRNPDEFTAAICDETRLIFAETIGNPGLEVLDIPAVAKVAHDAELPLLVDATFSTPALLHPFAHGADLIMHSATKWIGGHGVAIGGVLIDSGLFDWEASGKFPGMTEPYAGFHGLDFAEEFGPAAFIMRARAEGLRDFGACMAPQTAFYLLQGLETLPIRMARHVANAQAVAEFLEDCDDVGWVAYPGLPSHPDHALATRLLPDGAGAVVTFGVKSGTDGPRRAGAKFIEALELFSHLANVGDAKSLVIHPASTTHQQMGPDELAASGVGEDMVRLAIGLEDPGDIIGDLKQALRASQK